MAKKSNVDLLWAVSSYDGCARLLERLTKEKGDPAVDVLTFQAVFDIDERIKQRWDSDYNSQLGNEVYKLGKNILRKWRSDSPKLPCSETQEFVLRSLTIFEKLSVPLFIDDYGTKRPLSQFNETDLQKIDINEKTPIYHVTHEEEAYGILAKGFQPSKNKNIVAGVWFGLLEDDSHYGRYAFKTTLDDLGVTGLSQGEIVSYKNEVNVILYAADDHLVADFSNNLWEPTKEAAKKLEKGKTNEKAYVHKSIFVPHQFFKNTHRPDSFVQVPYHSMCVREKRNSEYSCAEKIGKKPSEVEG